MLQAVLFDMDDVLCAYDWAGRVAALARLSGRTVEALDQDIWRSGFEDAADRGEISADAYLQGFADRLGVPLSRADWIANRKAAMTPWPDMLALAASLKEAGLAIGVLTNNGRLTAETLDLLFPELRPLFGVHIHVSGALGLSKPDPASYLEVCNRMAVDPRRTLFTDDLVVNVAGAEKAGLIGHHFRGKAGLIEEVAQWGVCIPAMGD